MSWHFAGLVVEKRQCRINLRGGQSSRQESSAVDCIQVAGSAKHRDPGEIAFLFVVAEEEKRFILNYRSTNGAAELVAYVLRLEGLTSRDSVNQPIDECVRVARAPLVIAVIQERRPVKLIGPRLRHRVNNTARGASVLSSEV